MRKRVMGFFILLLMFASVLAVISYDRTGSMSNISGYSVSIEDETNSAKIYGGFLAGLLTIFLFLYISKFIFDSYDRRVRAPEIKKSIHLDLNDNY